MPNVYRIAKQLRVPGSKLWLVGPSFPPGTVVIALHSAREACKTLLRTGYTFSDKLMRSKYVGWAKWRSVAFFRTVNAVPVGGVLGVLLQAGWRLH